MPTPILTGLLTIALLVPMRGAFASELASEMEPIAASAAQSITSGTPKKTAPSTSSVWKKFTATQGRYTILMPGKPQTRSMPLTLPQGMKLKMWFTVGQEVVNSKTAYVSAYVDFPVDGNIGESMGQQALDAGIQNFLGAGNRREVSRSRFSLNGYPGQELYYRAPQGLSGRIRAFMVDNRLYVLQAETDREAANQTKMTNFLQSFKLL